MWRLSECYSLKSDYAPQKLSIFYIVARLCSKTSSIYQDQGGKDMAAGDSEVSIMDALKNGRDLRAEERKEIKKKAREISEKLISSIPASIKKEEWDEFEKNPSYIITSKIIILEEDIKKVESVDDIMNGVNDVLYEENNKSGAEFLLSGNSNNCESNEFNIFIEHKIRQSRGDQM